MTGKEHVMQNHSDTYLQLQYANNTKQNKKLHKQASYIKKVMYFMGFCIYNNSTQ